MFAALPSNSALSGQKSEEITKTTDQTSNQPKQSILGRVKWVVLSILNKIRNFFRCIAYFIPLHSTHTVNKLQLEAGNLNKKKGELQSLLKTKEKLLNNRQEEVSRLEEKVTGSEERVKELKGKTSDLNTQISSLIKEKELSEQIGEAFEDKLDPLTREVSNLHGLSDAFKILENFERENEETLKNLKEKILTLEKLTKDDQKKFVKEGLTTTLDFEKMQVPESLEAIVDKLTDRAFRSSKQEIDLQIENDKLKRQAIGSSKEVIRTVLEELKQDLKQANAFSKAIQNELKEHRASELEKGFLKEKIEKLIEFRSELTDRTTKKGKVLKDQLDLIGKETSNSNRERLRKIDERLRLINVAAHLTRTLEEKAESGDTLSESSLKPSDSVHSLKGSS